jgi:hypothetical protein
MTIISDDAKEFNVLDKKYHHKVSVFIHKAAFAETYIARTKLSVRSCHQSLHKQYFKGKIKSIPKEELLDILSVLQDEINTKAKIKIKKLQEASEASDSKYKLGDAVFIKSNEKFYEQLRKFKKQSYLGNFIMKSYLDNFIMLLWNHFISQTLFSLMEYINMVLQAFLITLLTNIGITKKKYD